VIDFIGMFCLLLTIGWFVVFGFSLFILPSILTALLPAKPSNVLK
jgi:hypothetical protein